MPKTPTATQKKAKKVRAKTPVMAFVEPDMSHMVSLGNARPDKAKPKFHSDPRK
jgi:hypothetical protein